MLRTIPGVQMNLEQVSIRGSSGYSKGVGARVLVAINGIPLYAGDNGDVVWEIIPVSDIERVEVIKGPSSSLYGSSAIGGVINIITKPAVKIPVTNFRSYFGIYGNPSYDIWKWNSSPRAFYGTELIHSNSLGKLGYTFSFKRFDNMSYRQNDFNKKYLGYLKLSYQFTDENSLTFFADYLNMNRGNFLYWKDSRNALVPKDEDNGNTVKSERVFTGLIYHHHFSDKFGAELKTSYYRTRFDGYGLEVTTSIADLVRGEALTNYKFSETFFLTSGVEASFSNVRSNIFSNTNFFSGGVYTQAEYKGIKDFIVTAGIRGDYIKIDTIEGKIAVTPRAGLNYKVTDNFILRTSVGTGFRAPTPAEIFTTTSLTGGLSVKGNPDLTAETNVSAEIGFAYTSKRFLDWDVAVFYTKYKNYIEPNIVSDGIKFLNVPNANVLGVENNITLQLIDNLLTSKIGYMYLWARDPDKNQELKYRPRHSINTNFLLRLDPFEFGLNFRFQSKFEEIDDLTTTLVVDGDKHVPIYVTDVMLGYNFLISTAPAKFYFNVKNVFNYNYVEFIGNLAPVRSFSISAEIYF
jgi:iron complex outermembrane receptor protein